MSLDVTEAIVNTVIFSLHDDKMLHVYYVSHVLAGAETQYSPLEKHIFNLVILVCKLKPYFQEHPAIVLTNKRAF